MQTQNQYSFAMTGPTSLAFETAVCNTLEAEDKIMVMVDGCIGQRVARISKAYGFGLIRLQVRNPGELVSVCFICYPAINISVFYSGTVTDLRGHR